MSATCWHCQDVDLCDCIFCGYFIAGGIWKAGKCSSCVGRRNFESIRARLDAENIDPREKRYYVRYFEGERWHVMFDPFFEHRHFALGRVLSDPARESSSGQAAQSREERGLDGSDFFAMEAPVERPKKRGKRK